MSEKQQRRLDAFGFGTPKASPKPKVPFRVTQSHVPPPLKSQDESNKTALRRSKDNDETQYVLDAGQKRFGPVHCSACNMFYTPDLRSDCLAHENYHKQKLLKQFAFKCCRLSNSLINDVKHNGFLISNIGGNLMIKVTNYCRHKLRSRIEQIFDEIINQELGFLPDDRKLWVNNRQCFARITSISPSQHLLVGIVLVEPIERAEIVQRGAVQEDDCGQVGRTVAAKLGVNRIWVHPEHRRQGIALQLLDCARNNFYMGHSIPRTQLAFTDPTEAGCALAERYQSDGRFLVYSYRT